MKTTIELGNVVMVSDPCYEDPTWCQAKLDNVLPGKYIVACEKSDTGDWGIRNSKLMAIHQDYATRLPQEDAEIWTDPCPLHTTLNWELAPFEIGVDSGQAGIFDINSYRKKGLKMDVPNVFMKGVNMELLEETIGDDDWYLNMTKMTLSVKGWGAYKNGVVSRSGYGDGGYELYVIKNQDGQIVGMKIDFLVVENQNN